MTRKRFVKLLMSKGHSRNGANSIARAVRGIYTYDFYMKSPFTFMEQATSSLCYPVKNYKINFQPYLNMRGEYVRY